MAVDNPWFWVLILIGGVLVAVAAGLYAYRIRRVPDYLFGDAGHEILMYLNEKVIMDLLESNDTVALKQTVEQYTRVSAEANGEIRHGPVTIVGRAGKSGDKKVTFDFEKKPITAIREVVQRLENADAIVYVDLHRGDALAHRTLLDAGAEGARLSGSRMFLSIGGQFQEYDEDGSDRTFLRLRAPYPAGGDAHVRVKITRSWLRAPEELPEGKGSFPARVLGKVEAWDENNGVLKIWALAIFR
ncbi:hypothetical protein ACWF82_20525 [Nocardia sp. NPDC055053]